VCLVAHLAYGALVGTGGHIGGVERQVSRLARWLAARGHQVSLVTWDEGQSDGVTIDGVRVVTLCRRDAGLPGLRFVHPRWTALHQALRRAEADVYYQNCGEYVTGQVALWCRQRGRRFVYSAAADADCDARLPLMRTSRERILYRLGLRYADRIIVQTRTQQRMLREGFRLDSFVIPMPGPDVPSSPERAPATPESGSGSVVWVGRICEVKRPDRFLDLAAACPQLRFDVVGPEDGSDYARSITQRASRMSNVVVHGAVGRDRVAGFYRHALCLCSTSDHEGFPNTFLEAWSHGLPVVSTLDPDGLITERGLGAVASDVPGLARGIHELIESPERWRMTSSNARRYFLDQHAPERALPRFERLFLDVVGGPFEAARRP
jgi:glycosyltransferase involved in cell wall biosynthesis